MTKSNRPSSKVVRGERVYNKHVQISEQALNDSIYLAHQFGGASFRVVVEQALRVAAEAARKRERDLFKQQH